MILLACYKMKMMKYSAILLLVLIGFTNFSFAQKIQVTEETKTVNGNKIRGFESMIETPFEKLSDEWNKSLRLTSKMKKKNNFYQIEKFEVNEVFLASFYGFARVYNKDSLSSIVWLGVDTNKTPDSLNQVYLEASKYFVTEFTFNHYRDKFQKEIENTERAVNFSSRQYQRYLTEENNLNNRLEDAEKEKIRLTNLLEETELDIAVLKQRLIDNKANQENTYLKIEQIKKVLDTQKSKLKLIN